MTLDSGKGEKLKELSEKNKVVFTCGFDERFNSGHRENKLSSPENIGIVFESSINDIDIANLIFGEFPVVVYARLGSIDENENFASIMLGYKNNKTAIVLSNGFSSRKIRKLKAICSDAVVSSDLNSLEVEVSNEDNPIHLEKNDSMLLHIQNFIGAIEGKNDLSVKPQETINLTKIAEAALLSSKQGVPIYLDLK
jgi:UDP-N-acetylglucosamine 3-dehydrogenase